MWNQVYDPFNNWILSTLAAALPVVTLLVLIASNKVKAHIAAIVALIVANLVAISIFTMPSGLALRATVLGAVTGFFPIGWIVLNVIFLYRLTVEKGTFETLQTTIGGVTTDRRLQLLLIAFSFGAFFEGASSTGKGKQSEPLPCRIKSGKANKSGNPLGAGLTGLHSPRAARTSPSSVAARPGRVLRWLASGRRPGGERRWRHSSPTSRMTCSMVKDPAINQPSVRTRLKARTGVEVVVKHEKPHAACLN